MTRRRLLLSVVALPHAAQAQDASTRLTLAETGMATRLPDVPVASLRAEARAASAAAAQQQLNRLMTAALEEARGVTPSTGRYAVQRVDENRAWLASQVLTLRGSDPAALTELVGSLQGRGLALEEMGWRLSDGLQRDAREEATRQGIAVLNQRASLVAGELGLRVLRIERLALDTTLDAPSPRMAQMGAAAMAARAAPPVSVPQEASGTVRITAEILLTPRRELRQDPTR